MLFRVIPGRIVPCVAGVEITLPYNRKGKVRFPMIKLLAR
jgi:hypothetical protein